MKTEVAPFKERSLAKGFVAGLIGGVVGTVAMSLTERVLPRHADASTRSQGPAVDGIPWGFGLAVGAAYGALAEFYPAATTKEGASFGMTLGVLTQGPALTELGAGDKPQEEPNTSEMTSHVVYGITTEFIRRFIRKRI